MRRLKKPVSSARWLSIAIILLTGVLVAAWRMQICIIFDDIFFLKAVPPDDTERFWNMCTPFVTNWGMLFESMVNHYMGVNGRLADLLCMPTIFMPQWLLSILQGAAVALSVMLIARAAAGRAIMRCPWLIAAIALVIWKWFPWSNSMVSNAFFFNYPLSGLTALAYSTIFLCGKRLPASLMAAGAAVAIVAGWMHEGFGIPLCAASAIIIATSRHERRQRIILTAFLIAGTMIASLAPSTISRINSANEESDYTDIVGAFVTTATHFYWIYVYVILLIAGALPRFRHKPLRSILREDLFWLVVCGVSLLILTRFHLSGSGFDRIKWPAAIAMLILCVRRAWDLAPSIRRPRKGLAVALTAILITFFASLIYWQRKVSDPQRRVLAEIVTAPIPTVYIDLIPQNELPWYLFGIPNQFELDGSTLLLSQLRDDADIYQGSAPLILPSRYRGKRFDEWDKVAGDNPLRGSMPWVYSPDSIDPGTPLRLHLGELAPSASPPARILARLRPANEARGSVKECRPCIEAPGDTIWVISIKMPRMATYHRIDAIDIL